MVEDVQEIEEVDEGAKSRSFPNLQGITEINYRSRVRCYCPMGSDFYSADVAVQVNSPVNIPDYVEVDAFIRSLDGQSFILEDVCAIVWNKLKADTNGFVIVAVESSDAVHSPVSVKKAG